MLPMRSISDQCMDSLICYQVIIAKRIGTKVIMGADLLFPAALALCLVVWDEGAFRGRDCLLVFPLAAIRAVVWCFCFSSRDIVVFAKLLFLVSAFHTAFSRGSSSTSTSMTRINMYDVCLFNR